MYTAVEKSSKLVSRVQGTEDFAGMYTGVEKSSKLVSRVGGRVAESLNDKKEES
jgi:hypothetical protein